MVKFSDELRDFLLIPGTSLMTVAYDLAGLFDSIIKSIRLNLLLCVLRNVEKSFCFIAFFFLFKQRI